MRPHLITARPEMPLEQAVELMRKNEIGCLPVLQDQHLLGLVTRKDLIPLGYAFDRD
jgi:FOG: CBS domain